MSDLNGSTTKDASADVKGKGKGAATEPITQDVSMDEADSSDEEDVDLVSDVSSYDLTRRTIY